jgi:hypothetical protein
MWETLKNKKDIIDTIMGDNKLTEEEITINLMDEIMNKLND